MAQAPMAAAIIAQGTWLLWTNDWVCLKGRGSNNIAYRGWYFAFHMKGPAALPIAYALRMMELVVIPEIQKQYYIKKVEIKIYNRHTLCVTSYNGSNPSQKYHKWCEYRNCRKEKWAIWSRWWKQAHLRSSMRPTIRLCFAMIAY